MSRTALFLAILLATGLAGCTDERPAPVEDECEDLALCDLDVYLQDHYCVQNDKARTYAPDVEDERGNNDPWQLGDWWEYSLAMSGQEAGTTKLVFYDIQDNGAHYMVGTPTREEALAHAVLSTNPVIGRVHQTLYSPHESGSHADMFNFPLCQGNSWTDVFFGTVFTFTVSQEEIDLPGARTDPGGYVIRGVADDGSTVTHTFSPITKWFTLIDVERADGTSVDMELIGFGSGASQQAYFLRGQQDEQIEIPETSRTQTVPFGREAGSSGSYDTLGLQLDLSRTEGTGLVELHIIDPDGVDVACIGLAGDGIGGDTDCVAPGQLLEVPWKEGNWEARLEVALVGTSARADIHMASIYDRSTGP